MKINETRATEMLAISHRALHQLTTPAQVYDVIADVAREHHDDVAETEGDFAGCFGDDPETMCERVRVSHDILRLTGTFQEPLWYVKRYCKRCGTDEYAIEVLPTQYRCTKCLRQRTDDEDEL